MKRYLIIPLLLSVALTGCQRAPESPSNVLDENLSADSTETAYNPSEEPVGDKPYYDGDSFDSYEEAVAANGNTADTEMLDYIPTYYTDDYIDVSVGNTTLGEHGELICLLASIDAYTSGNYLMTPEMFIDKYSRYVDQDANISEKIYKEICNEGVTCDTQTFSPWDAANALYVKKAIILLHINHDSLYGKGSTYLLLTGMQDDESGIACFAVKDSISSRAKDNSLGTGENGDLLYRMSDVAAMASDDSVMYVFK